ncbi:tRNA (guanine10-N2)-dimethyltransferase [Methanomicrobium sp. W14]|jgi:tRNA (guanine10-N2)-dimethyltransferase|uniref:methyltransferase domain-containing protein n=1 Tax=Methanomicrobium sp. W14 TaxID=2817839 RepID=UPI001AE3C7C3|nr:methyltransferase domain-containing protein [Methanomicrobium sp. W14]MBP2133886.1 tRNA (guanine10-N2)-dimethyltransferase [Methanomicrobium sp. W14]
MKLIFELSGEHPTLPYAEAECTGKILERGMQVAVMECPDRYAAKRLAMTHCVMNYLGECYASAESFIEMLDSLSIVSEVSFAGRVKKISDTVIRDSQLSLEKCIGAHIKGHVSLSNPGREFRAVFSGDKCYFGEVIYRIDRGGFEYRNPMRRAFFHPGVMMPILARTLVNLAMIKENETLLDPFCGTGGVLLEASLLKNRVIGADMDLFMLKGCLENLPVAEVLKVDSTKLPITDCSVDSVVTDLPYGQSVCIKAESMSALYNDSLSEMRRVLKRGKRAVVVTHVDIREIASKHFEVLQFHEQRVHKSLTRRIMVLA